jgi:protein-L-isoaspartate(D-aspartate) O-methyltransferase
VRRARQANGPRRLRDAAAEQGVADRRVLDALAGIPRELFVPESEAADVYQDRPVSLPHDQTTSQPSLIAAMVEALELDSDDVALEIGAGYGFQTALLAALCRYVWAIEWWSDLAHTARANLAAHGVSNAEVAAGDGHAGWPEHAPFHGIIISAATPQVPPGLTQQLAEGGRLVAPVGSRSSALVTVYDQQQGRLRVRRELVPARFVEMAGGDGGERRTRR